MTSVTTPFDISSRSLGRDLVVKRIGWRTKQKKTDNVSYIEQRHLTLSGCKDEQTSADAYIGGKYQGAMTAHFLGLLEDAYDFSWADIHSKLVDMLASNGYSQIPQLSGPEEVLKKKPFGGLNK